MSSAEYLAIHGPLSEKCPGPPHHAQVLHGHTPRIAHMCGACARPLLFIGRLVINPALAGKLRAIRGSKRGRWPGAGRLRDTPSVISPCARRRYNRANMRHHDLLRKLDDQPFRPFRIRLVNNTTYDIVDPGMVIVGDSSAVIATRNIRDDAGHRTTTD